MFMVTNSQEEESFISPQKGETTVFNSAEITQTDTHARTHQATVLDIIKVIAFFFFFFKDIASKFPINFSRVFFFYWEFFFFFGIVLQSALCVWKNINSHTTQPPYLIKHSDCCIGNGQQGQP